MADYAIYADKLGAREDVPTALLSEVFLSTESRNIHDEYGEWRKMKGRVPLMYDSDGNKIQTPIFQDSVTVASVVNKKFTIAGAHKTDIDAALLSSDNKIRINGSTDNDGLYTVDSVTEVAGPDTEIVVVEALTSTTADGSLFAGATPIICLHTYTNPATGTSYLLCGTSYHVWLWDSTALTLTLKFTSATPVNVLSMVMANHLGYVYMTNNVDKVQWWDTSSISNNFAVAGGASGIDVDGAGTYITKAKYLYSFKTYLFIGFVTYSTGTIYPKRAHWSGRGTGGATLDYDRNGASDTDFKDFNHEPSAITGFGGKGTDFIVAKNESMVKGWLVTEATVFEWDEETIKRGCVSGKTLVNDKNGLLYYLSNDFTLRELDTPDPVSGVIDKVMRDINPEYVEYSQATYIDEYKSIFFAVPTQESIVNNLVIEYNTIKTTCYLHDISVRAFGDYKRQIVFGYDTLPYSTYEEWGIAWLVYDTKVNTLGYPLDVCSDYSGNTFALHEGNKDDGGAWIGKLVISSTLTPSKSLYVYKRVSNGMDLTFNTQGEDKIDVRIKKDTGVWETVGYVFLKGEKEEGPVEVGYWKMDDNKATKVVIDSSTGGNNGISVQNTEDISATGRVNGALSFNGVTDYIDTNSPFESVLRDSHSVSVWIKPDDGVPTISEAIFGARDKVGPNSYIQLLLAQTTGLLTVQYNSEEQTTIAASAPSALARGGGVWYHVVFVITKDGTGATAQVFLNGVAGTLVSQTSVGMASFGSADNVTIGAWNDDGTVGKFFAGDIDDVRIYDKALSSSDVAHLYNNGSGTANALSEIIKNNISAGGLADSVGDVCISHLPFDKRARVFYFELSSTGNLELLGLVFREFYYDGDR